MAIRIVYTIYLSTIFCDTAKKLAKLIDNVRMYLIIGGYLFLCLLGLGIYMLVAVREMQNHETYMTSDGTIIVGETKVDYKPWIIKETETTETEVEVSNSDIKSGDDSDDEIQK